jgi:hypothetical protein
MENHDEAYWVWKEAGVREKILVHFDAHDDLSRIADRDSLNIGNFICQASKKGMGGAARLQKLAAFAGPLR